MRKFAAGSFVFASIVLTNFNSAYAGDFALDFVGIHNWPTADPTPPTFVMTDQYGFQLDATGVASIVAGATLNNAPNEVDNFGTIRTIRHASNPPAGLSGIGESTITSTLTFTSGGSLIPLDSLQFQITDIDAVDGNNASFNGDRCDLVTVTGNAGNPTLSYVSANAATRSVFIGPGPGAGASPAIAANQAQCIFETSTAVTSPNSATDDNGSIVAVFPSGTSSVTIVYDESIENVAGNTNLNAGSRGGGFWGGSAFVINQAISMVKSVDVATYVGAGEALTYTYVVTNDGPLPINTGQNIQINDDQIGIINCPAIASAIPVGGTQTCTGTYNTTAGDASSPSVVNIATAGVGTGAQTFATRLQSNNDTETVIREIPAITLSKAAGTPTTTAGAIPSLTDSGDTIIYSYTVNNTGNVPIENVTITDPGPTFNGNAGTGTLSAFSPGPVTIPAGNSQVFTATYTLSQLDVDNSVGITNAVENTANSTGASSGGVSATSNDSTANTTISGGPNITVTKVADQTSPTANVPAGVTVTYTYVVANTGNQTISDISLTDAHNGAGPAPTPTNETLTTDNGASGDSVDASVNGIWDSLAPGDEVTFTATYVVTQNDIDTLQ